jgi:hypothetical protein
MPSFQELQPMGLHDSFDRTQLFGDKPSLSRQGDGIKPELRRAVVAVHVHVRRFPRLVAEEV